MTMLFIPHVNRLDLLEGALESVNDSCVTRIVINNSGVPITVDAEAVIDTNVPLSASQSLNLIQRIACNEPFYLFMHSDAEASPGAVNALIAKADSLTAESIKWGVIFTNYDSLAAFRTEAFSEVGEWDTNLPQYFTDNDMYRRLRLAGWELIDSGIAVNHYGSQTIRSDSKRGFINSITFPLYRQYYVRKWGGEPGHECYNQPFGL